MKVNTDYSLTGVRSGLTKNRRMSWGQSNTDTFYSNGIQNGYIREGVSNAWPSGIPMGPNSEVINFESSAPIANHISFRQGGQLIISVGSEIYINHEPFQFGLFNKRSGYIQFESDITMLCGTKTGFFASDGKRTWFFKKLPDGWFKFQQNMVDYASVVEGSLAIDHINLLDIGLEQPGIGYVWLTNRGICLGTEDGNVVNLTKNKIKLPSLSGYGAGLIKEKTAIFIIPVFRSFV